jgi:hypothetical protein
MDKILEIKKKLLNDEETSEPELVFLVADIAESLSKISSILESRLK